MQNETAAPAEIAAPTEAAPAARRIPYTESPRRYQIITPAEFIPIVIREGRVIGAPRQIDYMAGWETDRLLDYCSEKGWGIERL